MSSILTTLTILIGLGLAIETTILPTIETCIDPTGTLPPPPAN